MVVGPDNPDFAPYEQISPYLVGSIMTTEDNGFFKHHGWVSSEFKSALRRNLQGGGFRLGASSITMQMTKNVLLTKDKTLSRKLQELFLVWYLEQELPKERILELYFNAIEFGPRIYGIGAATRHYFGKKPADLTPLEAAFFSSILPSARSGATSSTATARCRRSGIATSGGSSPRCTSAGGSPTTSTPPYSAQPFVFDRSEASFTEKQCLDWVKSMAAQARARDAARSRGGRRATATATAGRRRSCGGCSRTPSRTTAASPPAPQGDRRAHALSSFRLARGRRALAVLGSAA